MEDGIIYRANWGSLGESTSIFNFGFSVRGGLNSLSRLDSTKNAMIVGSSGSGKTSTICVGSLYKLAMGNSSLCVMDISGLLYKITSGYYARRGYRVFCFDRSKYSDCFNCLDYVKSNIDIQHIAHVLIRNSGVTSKTDLYWQTSAEQILSVMIQYVLNYTAKEFHSLVNVYRLLQIFSSTPEKCDQLFAKVDDDLLLQYKSVISAPEKVLMSSVSTALVGLKIFSNPDIARVTSSSTFNLYDFRTYKSIIYFVTPIMEASTLAPISCLMYEILFKIIMERQKTNDEKFIYAIIDELGSLKFSNLGLVYSAIRGFGGGVMGIIQDSEMLRINFSEGERHSLLSNSFLKCYLPGQNLAECRRLEELLGLQTIQTEKGQKVRPLMLASEIRMSDKEIAIIGNKEPLLLTLKPYYRHWLFSGYSNIPALERAENEIGQPPLLKL